MERGNNKKKVRETCFFQFLPECNSDKHTTYNKEERWTDIFHGHAINNNITKEVAVCRG